MARPTLPTGAATSCGSVSMPPLRSGRGTGARRCRSRTGCDGWWRPREPSSSPRGKPSARPHWLSSRPEAAASQVRGPFAVVNADDFYGRDAFTRAAEFLVAGHAGEASGTFANIAYPLRNTLSAAGGVNRAVVCADGDGWLETVEEIVEIRRLGSGAYEGIDPRGRPVRLGADALVSMNLWVFTPVVCDLRRRGFAEFLRQADAERSEFLISQGIREAVRRGEARVRLLDTRGRWLGMTYPDDRPRVEEALRQLVAAGEYPERLWG